MLKVFDDPGAPFILGHKLLYPPHSFVGGIISRQ